MIVPGILPNLFNDLRILLGAAWTLLMSVNGPED